MYFNGKKRAINKVSLSLFYGYQLQPNVEMFRLTLLRLLVKRVFDAI